MLHAGTSGNHPTRRKEAHEGHYVNRLGHILNEVLMESTVRVFTHHFRMPCSPTKPERTTNQVERGRNTEINLLFICKKILFGWIMVIWQRQPYHWHWCAVMFCSTNTIAWWNVIIDKEERDETRQGGRRLQKAMEEQLHYLRTLVGSTTHRLLLGLLLHTRVKIEGKLHVCLLHTC